MSYFDNVLSRKVLGSKFSSSVVSEAETSFPGALLASQEREELMCAESGNEREGGTSGCYRCGISLSIEVPQIQSHHRRMAANLADMSTCLKGSGVNTPPLCLQQFISLASQWEVQSKVLLKNLLCFQQDQYE